LSAPGLYLGIAGLPPMLAQMSRGRVYAADVANEPWAVSLAAGTLARCFVQKRVAAAVAGLDLPALLEALQKRDVDPQRAQARGLIRFFRALPGWGERLQRVGGAQFLDELDHYAVDGCNLLVIDGAEGLFSWGDRSALQRQGLRLRSWCESSGCTVLLLFRDDVNPGRTQQLHRASSALSGIASLGNRDGTLAWSVGHWHLGRHRGGSSRQALRSTETGELVAAGSDQFTQRQVKAWLENARDQEQVWITRAAMEPGLPAAWTIVPDNAALLAAADQALAATCILDSGRPQEFRQLTHCVHQLRKRRGRALKIVVRQRQAPLRHGQESILLTAGANLILAPGATAEALTQAVTGLLGQVLSRDVPDQLEQVLASAAPPARSGYLPPAAFCAEALGATDQAHAAGIECTLVRLFLLPEVAPIEALRACKPLRAGDVFTADDRSVYLFLFACWEQDADKAVERVFRMMLGELFEGQLRLPGRSAIQAEAGDLQYRAQAQSLPDHGAELADEAATGAATTVTQAAPVQANTIGVPRTSRPSPLGLRAGASP
jgi:cellulose biosynthesis protein BcsE